MSRRWSADVDRGDLDEVIRGIDGLVDDGAWGELADLRERCRRAHERGHQLWPAACYAAHHLALGAPAEAAVAVLDEPSATHFGPGPLWEVVASTHTWAELRPHLEAGPTTTLIAEERVLRGDPVRPTAVRSSTGEVPIDLSTGEVPMELSPVEPRYLVATYRGGTVRVDDPPRPPLRPARSAGVAATLDADGIEEMWRLVVQPWLEQSGGTFRCVAVEGDATAAAGALAGDVLIAPIDLTVALSHLQWAAASGGALGRRRGGAVGRTLAWWAVATLAGAIDDWPLTGRELADWGGELEWCLWEPAAPGQGWQFRLAVSDPGWGCGWAVEAVDDPGEDASG